MANTTLKFMHYIVPKVNAQINTNFDFKQTQNVTLQPKFRRDIIKINENEFNNQLTITIESEEGKVIPFNIEVSIRGAFLLDNWQDEDNKDLVNLTSTATLFPYLRAIVSQVSTMLNMPPYILPLLNISELFKEENVKKAE
jgi:preprotein translocase subunit SecB